MAHQPTPAPLRDPEESFSSMVRRAGNDATALADPECPSTIALSARVSPSIIEPRLAHDPGSHAAVRFAPAPGQPAWFEDMYRDARGDPARVPWAQGAPNPHLVNWLNAHAPARLRPGARVIVIGCGLGDDVVELINRGYDAVGFDISPTSIEWARSRFPDHARSFFAADLLQPPARLRHRFDLVVEVYTLQSLVPPLRRAAASSVAAMACPRGAVLAVARGRDENVPLDHDASPPWPFTAEELANTFESAGMKPDSPIDCFSDDESPSQLRLRALFTHA